VHARAPLDLEQVEDVAARGVSVERVLRDRAVRLGFEQVAQRLLLRLDLRRGQALDRHAAPAITQQGELGARAELGERGEQVVEVLVVYLEEREARGVHPLRPIRHLSEDAPEGTRRDPAQLVVVAVADHGEGLARARLAVAHDRAIETLEHRVADRPAHLLEDALLRGVVEHGVARER
jgi:hypothetical protein